MRIDITKEDIRKLHEKYAKTRYMFDLVYTHCQIVRDIALELVESSGSGVDRRLLEIGCLLHDIGVYELYDENSDQSKEHEYITHGILGYQLLKHEGFSEEICRFASHHTGSGLTRQQIVSDNLPLPHQDLLAETTEEELVMYADKFHSKTDPPVFNSFDYYAKKTAKFGEDSVRRFRDFADKYGKPDLEPLTEKYGYQIRRLV